jgi:hypothetical protein
MADKLCLNLIYEAAKTDSWVKIEVVNEIYSFRRILDSQIFRIDFFDRHSGFLQKSILFTNMMKYKDKEFQIKKIKIKDLYQMLLDFV